MATSNIANQTVKHTSDFSEQRTFESLWKEVKASCFLKKALVKKDGSKVVNSNGNQVYVFYLTTADKSTILAEGFIADATAQQKSLDPKKLQIARRSYNDVNGNSHSSLMLYTGDSITANAEEVAISF